MTDLITKLEEAGEGSRALDVAVARSLGQQITPATYLPTGRYRENLYFPAKAEPYTQSLDAALALASRVLPGCRWETGVNSHEKAWATVYSALFGYEGRASNPALALCAAILRASEQERGG